jgi:hypothetical protein
MMDMRGTDNLTMFQFSELLEKGRRRALAMMMTNPESRDRVEKAFGLDYCKGRYPELYGINRPPVYDEPGVDTFKVLGPTENL